MPINLSTFDQPGLSSAPPSLYSTHPRLSGAVLGYMRPQPVAIFVTIIVPSDPNCGTGVYPNLLSQYSKYPNTIILIHSRNSNSASRSGTLLPAQPTYCTTQVMPVHGTAYWPVVARIPHYSINSSQYCTGSTAACSCYMYGPVSGTVPLILC